MLPVWLVLVAACSLSLSACFESNGGSNYDPCGLRRESVSKARVFAGAGAVAAVFNEGDLVMLGADGAFRWSVNPNVDWRTALVRVVGDVAFVVDVAQGAVPWPNPVWVIDGKGVTKKAGPKSECNPFTIQPELDGVRLVGVAGQTACSYRVRANATVDDEVMFDGPGTHGVGLRNGGYVLVADGALIRYDAAGQTQWVRADLAATRYLVEADGGLFVIVAEADAWSVMWIGLDGVGERIATRMPFIPGFDTAAGHFEETTLGIGTMFALGADVIFEMSHYIGAHTLMRVSPTTVVWANTMRPQLETLVGVTEGQVLLSSEGSGVSSLDTSGVERFVQPKALAATVSGETTYVVDTIQIDTCRRFGEVTALAPDGTARWTWHP